MSAKGQLRAPLKSESSGFDDVWRRTAERLRLALGDSVFNSWFGSVRVEEFVAGRVRLSVSTRFLKSWIENHYQERLLAALSAELKDVTAVEVFARTMHPNAGRPANGGADTGRKGPEILANDVGATAPASPVAARKAESVVKSPLGSPLDRRLTFATFIGGRANQLALSLARKLSEGRDAGASMTPLYIHAAVGLGKTHLLQAIAHSALARHQSVVYLTAEAFMYGFVNALRNHSAIAFKESLRTIDLLIFDDAQFLQGRVIQSEFGHVLNSLIDAGRQVVIAADRPPSDLEFGRRAGALALGRRHLRGNARFRRSSAPTNLGDATGRRQAIASRARGAARCVGLYRKLHCLQRSRP